MKRQGHEQGKLTCGGQSVVLNRAGPDSARGSRQKKKKPALGGRPGQSGKLDQGPAGFAAPEAP